LQFERLASASGPTLGEIRRPLTEIPEKIVFLACADRAILQKVFPTVPKYVVCILQTCYAYQHKSMEENHMLFYMDIRAGGKQL